MNLLLALSVLASPFVAVALISRSKPRGDAFRRVWSDDTGYYRGFSAGTGYDSGYDTDGCRVAHDAWASHTRFEPARPLS